MKRKTFGHVTIKDATQGLVEAVFATLDVVDHDNDVTRKGAITEGAPVVISAYNHKSWGERLPVGKGTVHEIGDKLVLKGQFFLNTSHGRDTFETVKALAEDELDEWSYSLEEVTAERGVVDGKAVNVLTKIGRIREVSPVLAGAGIGTGALSVKGQTKQVASDIERLLNEAGTARWDTDGSYSWLYDWDPDSEFAVFRVSTWTGAGYDRRLVQVDIVSRTDSSVELGDAETDVTPTTAYVPKSARFAEHREGALRAVKDLVTLGRERLAQRAPEGKSIDEQINAHDELMAELATLKQAIDEATNPASSDDDVADEATAEFLRFVALTTNTPQEGTHP